LRFALFTDARYLSLGLCLKAQSPLLLTPTFVTVLRFALFTDARYLSLGLCLKAQSPLLLNPNFVNDRPKAKGSNGTLEADERNFDQGAERISTQVEKQHHLGLFGTTIGTIAFHLPTSLYLRPRIKRASQICNLISCKEGAVKICNSSPGPLLCNIFSFGQQLFDSHG
jgi:hypothetical protein